MADHDDDCTNEPWLPGSMQAVIYAAERDTSLRIRRTATSVLGVFLVGRPQMSVMMSVHVIHMRHAAGRLAA